MLSLSRFTPGALTLALGLAVAALGLAAPSLAPSRAAAQDADRERARTEFQRGVDAYGRGEYQAALDAFQEAYRLAPHPMVRVNIANAYEQLDRPLEALFHFERFLAESTSATREQRREVDTAIRRLRQRVGELDLHVFPDGALVTIDGAEQRRAPVTEPVRVVAGEHTIDVQLEGYRPERRTVQVAGGATERVDVRLARGEAVASATGTGAGQPATTTTSEPASGEPAASEPAGAQSTESTVATAEPSGEPVDEGETTAEPAQPSGEGFRITLPVWIAGGVTVAAGIGAGVTGGLALAANSDYEGHLADFEDASLPPAAREQARIDGRAAADSASTLAVVTDVLLITTIIGAGATAFLLITTQEGGLLDDEESGPQVAIAPMVGEGLGGALVVGAF